MSYWSGQLQCVIIFTIKVFCTSGSCSVMLALCAQIDQNMYANTVQLDAYAKLIKLVKKKENKSGKYLYVVHKSIHLCFPIWLIKNIPWTEIWPTTHCTDSYFWHKNQPLTCDSFFQIGSHVNLTLEFLTLFTRQFFHGLEARQRSITITFMADTQREKFTLSVIGLSQP